MVSLFGCDVEIAKGFSRHCCKTKAVRRHCLRMDHYPYYLRQISNFRLRCHLKQELIVALAMFSFDFQSVHARV